MTRDYLPSTYSPNLFPESSVDLRLQEIIDGTEVVYPLGLSSMVYESSFHVRSLMSYSSSFGPPNPNIAFHS